MLSLARDTEFGMIDNKPPLPPDLADLSASLPSENESARLILMHLSQWLQEAQNDPVELLNILRLLEGLHRQICDIHFQQALPNTRHGLYTLLREIETEGGWPYIPRMHLKTILHHLTLSAQDRDGS